MNRLPRVGLSLVVMALIAVTACTGGSKDESTATAGPEPTATSSVQATTGISPTSTPRSDGGGSALYAFDGEAVSIGLSSDWRISSQSADSVAYTHVDAPGTVLLNVQWVEDATEDFELFFLQRLELLADATEPLEPSSLSGSEANRYLTTFVDADGEVITVALNVTAFANGTAILVTYAAPPDVFENFARDAESVIESIKIK